MTLILKVNSLNCYEKKKTAVELVIYEVKASSWLDFLELHREAIALISEFSGFLKFEHLGSEETRYLFTDLVYYSDLSSLKNAKEEFKSWPKFSAFMSKVAKVLYTDVLIMEIDVALPSSKS